MTVLAVDTTAVRVAQDIRANGGSTRSVVPGVPSPTGGYAVSLKGFQETFPHWSDETIAEYIERHRFQLAQPGRFIGAWIDDGQLYLDVSVVVADLQIALDMGRRNDQLAIFDVASEQEIRLDSVEPFRTAA